MNQSLLIIGPDIELRGVGGVTIHVRRLRDYLEVVGEKYDFEDYKRRTLWTLGRVIRQHKIVHIHISNPICQFLVVLLCRLHNKKVILTLHGNYGRFGKIKNTFVKTSLKLATVPIVINEQSYRSCKSFNNNILLIPAFIPPQKEEVLPNEAIAVLESIHKGGKKVYTTNASNVAEDKFGNDIYGIDFLVHYFKNYVDKALVVSDPSGNYEKKYSGLQSSSVFFLNYPHSYYEVLKRADYSIRNTSTDGDALSVRESLYLGIPTLCTDVVDRPKGVELFKYNDLGTFEKAMNTKSIVGTFVENGAEKILEVYKELMTEK